MFTVVKDLMNKLYRNLSLSPPPLFCLTLSEESQQTFYQNIPSPSFWITEINIQNNNNKKTSFINTQQMQQNVYLKRVTLYNKNIWNVVVYLE